MVKEKSLSLWKGDRSVNPIFHKHSRHFKRRLLAVLLMACLLLSACGGDAQPAADDAALVLPEPEVQQTQNFLGETNRSAPQEITLYYASDNRYALTSVSTAIAASGDEELIEAVLTELFSASSEALPHTAASGATLLDFEYSCSTVSVNLSLDSLLYQNEIEAQLFIASIVNTLMELDGVNAVNILIGGRSIRLSGLPIGTYTESIGNVSAVYAQLETESERFLNEDGVSIVRNVMLYFPSAIGEYMLPEVREIEFTSDDYISQLIDALKRGPLTETAAVSSIPESVDLLNAAPFESVTAAGERIVYLDFNSLLLNYLAFAGLDEWELYAGIVLTLTSFIPEIDAVCIMIDGEYLKACALPDHRLEIENGMVYRSDFSVRIGSVAELYFANAEGRLVQKRCALSQTAAASPKRLLEHLLRTQPTESDLYSVFPEGISADDVLGITIDNRIASVNLSANFYVRCQSLSENEERCLVYALVNTLCKLKSIGAVRFYVEGISVKTLVDDIYLKTALLPDFGLVEE